MLWRIQRPTLKGRGRGFLGSNGEGTRGCPFPLVGVRGDGGPRETFEQNEANRAIWSANEAFKTRTNFALSLVFNISPKIYIAFINGGSFGG